LLRCAASLCLPKKGVPKKGTPTSGFRCAKLPSLRPPEGDRTASLRNLRRIKVGSVWLLLFNCDGTDDAQVPFRRPSGITVEGVERHGCRESCDGPGMALRSVPLER